MEWSWIWWLSENPSSETTLEFEEAYDLILMCVGYYELCSVVVVVCVGVTAPSSFSSEQTREMK